jgi:aryl-alcohol dehydrogenase-like predicted oxidoreductase
VQFPLNLLDQRFIASGLMPVLAAKGTEIHVRSIFLQGILLTAPETLPARFAPMRPALEAVRRLLAAHRLTALAACLRHVLSRPEVTCAVIGVTGADELAEIVEALQDPVTALPDFATIATEDEAIIRPARWPAGAVVP